MKALIKKILDLLNSKLGGFIPVDKILHGVASFAVLFLTVAIMAVCYFLGLSPISTMFVIGGWIAGISVEGTQWNDNKNAEEAGQAPVHGVEFWDCVASAFAPTLAAVVYEVLRALHLLPSWAMISFDRIPPWMT
jgi:hypothetical protein